MTERFNKLNEHELSMEGMLDAIEAIQKHYLKAGVQTALVGSLGRKYSLENSDFSLWNPLSQKIRDIDLFCMPTSCKPHNNTVLTQAENIAYPFTVEETYNDKITLHNNQFHIRYKDIELPVDNKIFELQTNDIKGREITTLNPMTLFHITALYGPMRPKDFQSLCEFGREMRHASNKLPEEMYFPFHTLLKETKLKYPNDAMIWNIRFMYRESFSLQTREHLATMVDPLVKMITKMYGWIDTP